MAPFGYFSVTKSDIPYHRSDETPPAVKNISSLIICNKTAKEERALTNNITSFLSDNIGLVLLLVLVLILLL